jgi:hypothetical protein
MTDTANVIWNIAKSFLWFAISFDLAFNQQSWLVGCVGLFIFVSLESRGLKE